MIRADHGSTTMILRRREADPVHEPERELGGMPVVRLDWHLWNWSRWMRSDGTADGYPGKSPVFIAGGNSRAVAEMEEDCDKRCAIAVDAIMHGLSTPERAAISHRYLHAVFRFPRNNLPYLLREARLKIARGLVARGFY